MLDWVGSSLQKYCMFKKDCITLLSVHFEHLSDTALLSVVVNFSAAVMKIAFVCRELTGINC